MLADCLREGATRSQSGTKVVFPSFLSIVRKTLILVTELRQIIKIKIIIKVSFVTYDELALIFRWDTIS